jgi:hypothetical protein
VTGRRRRTRRPTLSAATATVGLVLALLLPVAVAQPAHAAGVPGSFAWTETLDGGNTFRLAYSGLAGTRVLAPQTYGRPALSPDGSRIAWTAPLTDGSDGRYGLFVSGVDGSGRRQLTAPAIGDFDAAWSPDGRNLVVSRDERGSFEPSCCTLVIVAADGSATKRLANATSARQPTWSPDGGTIAYTGPDGIYFAGANGSGNRRVMTGAYSWPTISPDGARVAAVRRTGLGTGTISVVPTAGGTPVDTSAGTGGGTPEAPVFADPSTLLFVHGWGLGEEGRTRAEVRRTTVGGATVALHRTGAPMFYFSWSRGTPCPVQLGSPPSAAEPSPAVARLGTFHLRSGQQDGTPVGCFAFGRGYGDVPLTGDWDGDGRRTVGVFRAGTFYLADRNSAGAAVTVVPFGSAGDVPVVGDWDGNGTDTIGVFRRGTWFLRNSNTPGNASVVQAYGSASFEPLVGDWDANGTDTLGARSGNSWYLTNSLSSSQADAVFRFGSASDLAVVGDWDGNGSTTLGVFRGGQWFLTNRLRDATADEVFGLGRAGDRPLVWW